MLLMARNTEQHQEIQHQEIHSRMLEMQAE